MRDVWCEPRAAHECAVLAREEETSFPIRIVRVPDFGHASSLRMRISAGSAMARALQKDSSRKESIMNQKTTNTEIETKKQAEEPKPERARLTVEVPTEITAGLAKNCVSCYCSRAYCC